LILPRDPSSETVNVFRRWRREASGIREATTIRPEAALRFRDVALVQRNNPQSSVFDKGRALEAWQGAAGEEEEEEEGGLEW